MAHNRISIPVEHCYLVPPPNYTFTTLVVENYDIISLFLLVVDYYLGAPLAKGLYDFGSLWPCASSHRTGVCAIDMAAIPLICAIHSTESGSAHLP